MESAAAEEAWEDQAEQSQTGRPVAGRMAAHRSGVEAVLAPLVGHATVGELVVPARPPEHDGAALAAACLRAEPGALERLVQLYQAEVFGTVLRIVRDRETALELSNTIFYKVYQNLGSYDSSRPLRPWLLRIATNEALNWLRSRQREREHVLGTEASDVAFQQLPAGDDPEAAALATEARGAVRGALARLPAHYRLVLTLRFFNDLSYQEIAEQTGQDANTVGVQLLRARQLLKRELLKEEGNTDDGK